ncbi:MAG: peptidyl-prolyl cis-trans isomerase [Phycisphaeraceae bacterium]|nr:peptidyl-prolyl cis-trans isomerase [Phycisphaeraceae bacterium]
MRGFSARSVLRISGAVAVWCVAAASGCGAERGSAVSDDGRLVARRDRPASSIVRSSTPATIDGEPVTWDDLLPILSEAAGGEALEELAFDRLLAREAEREGIVITEDDTRREEALLAESIGQAAGADAATAQRLLLDVRRARNLGPARYAALLKRTAILRRLVAEEVHVTNAAVEQMFEIRHGERFRARIITVASERTAEDVRRRALGGEPFGELAAEFSTDSSAERGGLIESISAADPTYPSGLRAALRAAEPGGVGPVIALDGAYAVVRVEARIAPDGVNLDAVRGELERAVRLRQERLAMGVLGERLLEGARITVFDRGLSRSWEDRRDR